MIYTFIPYCPKKEVNLGKAYNEFMKLLPKDSDWACLIDHDVMFTTKNWWHQLNDIIKKHPEFACFTAKTNRIASPWQKEGDAVENFNITYHIEIGKGLQENHYDEVEDKTEASPMSGLLMLVKKEIWNKVKFQDGFSGVDNNFHKDLREKGYKIGLMKGVYLFHLHL